MLLDTKHRKLRDVMVSKGSLTASIVHPRDIFAQVVRWSAAAIIFVHNHPSGDPTPSKDACLPKPRRRQSPPAEAAGRQSLSAEAVAKAEPRHHRQGPLRQLRGRWVLVKS